MKNAPFVPRSPPAFPRSLRPVRKTFTVLHHPFTPPLPHPFTTPHAAHAAIFTTAAAALPPPWTGQAFVGCASAHHPSVDPAVPAHVSPIRRRDGGLYSRGVLKHTLHDSDRPWHRLLACVGRFGITSAADRSRPTRAESPCHDCAPPLYLRGRSHRVIAPPPHRNAPAGRLTDNVCHVLQSRYETRGAVAVQFRGGGVARVVCGDGGDVGSEPHAGRINHLRSSPAHRCRL
jgi:hypothetical protein